MLQIVFESLAAGRGDAYDQTVSSIVGLENMAIARAISFDLYGANERLANSFLPTKATVASGMLPRWERVFGLNPAPTDTEVDRRNAVATAWARLADDNVYQTIADQVQAAIGPIFVSIVHNPPATALVYWPGGTPNALAPWYSTVLHILVVLTQNVAGYKNADGSPNALFYATAGKIGDIMDKYLPAYVTWDTVLANSGGTLGFKLDDPGNLDNEVFA